MAHGTMDAYKFVCRPDHTGKIADSPKDKKQKAATILVRDEIRCRTLPNLLLHVSPESLDQSEDSLLHRFCPRCVMRHGLLAPGWLLVFSASSAMVFVRRNDFMLRERNKDVELDARMNPILFQTTTNASSCTTSSPRFGGTLQFCRGGAIFSTTWLPKFFFLRSLQYGIVVMGVIDAFVYAHNHHRRNVDYPGNYVYCTKGRIRIMTAITLAYAHAHQSICLAGRLMVVTI